MGKALTILFVVVLAGCGEVTKFRDEGGGPVYFVDCGNSLRLFSSCRGVIESTCPEGYETLPITARHPGDRSKDAATSGFFRCVATKTSG